MGGLKCSPRVGGQWRSNGGEGEPISYTKNIFMFKCFAARLINHLAKCLRRRVMPEGGREPPPLATGGIEIETRVVAGQSCRVECVYVCVC